MMGKVRRNARRTGFELIVRDRRSQDQSSVCSGRARVESAASVSESVVGWFALVYVLRLHSPSRLKITLFIPCFVDLCYPRAGISMVKIFEQLGHEVDYRPDITCCGQPAFNSGYWDEARPVAERTLDLLADAEAVVSASGSCGAMLKVFYQELFQGTPREAAAKRLAGRCFEFSEFLVDRLGVTDIGARFVGKATFHDGCHGLRELGVRSQPRKLLENVRGLEVVEMKEAESCCGFGGTFAAKFPAISTAMGEVKCASAIETGADFIISNDSSCLMQIQGLLDRQGQPMKSLHLAEVLASR